MQTCNPEWENEQILRGPDCPAKQFLLQRLQDRTGRLAEPEREPLLPDDPEYDGELPWEQG